MLRILVIFVIVAQCAAWTAQAQELNGGGVPGPRERSGDKLSWFAANDAASAVQPPSVGWVTDPSFTVGDFIVDIIAADDGTLFVATWQHGIYSAPAFGGPWTKKMTGLRSHLVTSFVMTRAKTLIAGTSDLGVFRSTDAGESWAPSTSGLTDTRVEDMDLGPDGVVYAGTGDGVFRSVDDGLTWKAIGPSLTNIWTVMGASAGRVFISTSQGTPARTADSGRSWRPFPPSFGPIAIFGLAPGGTVYAAASDLAISTDNGDTWNLTPVSVELETCMRWNAQGRVFAGARSAVNASDDSGRTWFPYGNNIGPGSIYVIAIDRDGYLLAGTYQGALWRTANTTTSAVDREHARPDRVVLDGAAPNPVSGHCRISFALPVPGHARLSLSDMMGREIQVPADKDFDGGRNFVQLDASNLPNGCYVVRLTASGQTVSDKLIIAR